MVWAMHDEEVKTRIEALLRGDRTLHIQQLGVAWEPPEELSDTQESVHVADKVVKEAKDEEAEMTLADTIVQDTSSAFRQNFDQVARILQSQAF